jgi:membrane protein DedA with SNARE-associated domain/rhodanese-related sulfurtransferase
MPNLIHLLEHYGVLIVFAVVLVEQIGMPIPAFPILIVAGALSVDGDMNWLAAWAVALLACTISDFTWYRAGRHFGKRILKLLCRISLSPDYCVSQTEDNFNRWGPKALAVSKFIPGFNTIAAPMSGALGTRFGKFFAYSLLGSLLWSGSGIALGAIFHSSVDRVLDVLGTMGSTALAVVAGLLGLFVLFKFIERKRFRKTMQIERIGIEELAGLIDGGHAPVLVDARSATAQQLEAAIPGALPYNGGAALPQIAALGNDRHIIVYCSCPDDITAAAVAKQLHAQGFLLARPLRGGLDAWKSFTGNTEDAPSGRLASGMPR